MCPNQTEFSRCGLVNQLVKCILFESKWIVPTVFENQLEISSANKWRSINYDRKIFWGVGLAKTQQGQIVATHPKTS